MKSKKPFTARLARILLSDNAVPRWMMGWGALLLSAGMFLTTMQLSRIVDRPLWGALLALYGACQVAASLYTVPKPVRVTCGALGLWMWSYLFLSFAVFGGEPVRATELMLAIPLITDVWILAGDLDRRKVRRGKW